MAVHVSKVLGDIASWVFHSRHLFANSSSRGCFCSLETVTPGSVGRGLYISITAMMLFCFLTTFIAYFIVLRIIRGHQQQVQANERCHNFAQPAINLAK